MSRSKDAHHPTEGKWQYLIAVAILLTGCVLSAAILYSHPFSSGRDAPTPQEIAESSAEASEPTAAQGDASDTPAPVEYTVVFFNYDGKQIGTQTVPRGGHPTPPSVSDGEHIFKGWSQELFFIGEDMQVYPLTASPEGQKNVFWIDAGYCSASDPIELPVYLGGEVDACKFAIEIGYDSILLSFDGVGKALSGLTAEPSEDGESILLRYDAQEKLTASTRLGLLRFTCRTPGSYTTKLSPAAKEIYTQANGQVIYTDGVAYGCETRLFDKEKE